MLVVLRKDWGETMYERIIERQETIFLRKRYVKINTYEYRKRKFKSFSSGVEEFGERSQKVFIQPSECLKMDRE